MQPVQTIWAKIPRMVRDAAHHLGKRIAVEMEGGDTELDRQVLEHVRDPLLHLVRNAADYGIESPDERRAAGKPEEGRIALEAKYLDGQIVIEVSDEAPAPTWRGSAKKPSPPAWGRPNARPVSKIPKFPRF